MSTRKDFLATAPLLTLAPALTGATPPTAAPTNARHATPSFVFDQARFDEILAAAARHRQCFGAKKLDGGSVMEAMQNSIDAYESYLREPAGSMHAAAVLYHGTSLALAMSDALWDGVLAPLVKRGPSFLRDELKDVKFGKGNPYLHSTSKAPDDVSVERLVQQGAAFFVCHNAVAGFASLIAETLKIPEAEAHDRIMAAVVPGALVVPAGVMAINACQEAHFTYIATS